MLVKRKILWGLLGAGLFATAAYAATITQELGATTGPGGILKLWGSTSGSLSIQPPAVAGTGSTLTLPGGTTDFSATGGTGQVLQQATSGAAITVGLVPVTLLATGTSVSLTAPREYYVCTSTCTVTPPVPAAGYEFCVMNTDNVSTVITLAALGSSARYEATARTSYGTAGTGTLVSGGAAADKLCLLGLDSTHYLTVSYNGTWTAN